MHAEGCWAFIVSLLRLRRWLYSSRLLPKESWTRRGWVQVSSMETLRWGSCDSQEAPPRRISSSVIARGRGPCPHLRPQAHTDGTLPPGQWQVIATILYLSNVAHALICDSSLVSATALGVFWCVRPIAVQFHTPWMGGYRDHWNPWPLTSGTAPTPPVSGQGNASVSGRWDHKVKPPDQAESRVVCTGSPAVVLPLCFSFWFYYHLHAFYVCTLFCKLLMANYFGHIHCSTWIWFQDKFGFGFWVVISLKALVD